jgi:glycosyltransferase involved in cell wall biosynthesis
MDPDDTAGWTDAINRVLTDSGLANRLAKTGYLQAQKFTWAKTAEATLALYRGEWEH